MSPSSSPNSVFPRPLRPGFSLVEIIVTVAVIGVLATLGFMMMSNTKAAVGNTKLRTDVTRLNQVVSSYLADGGSLDGLTTAQQVIDKLKTVRTQADARRQAGALTGRGLDVRLSAKMQTSAEAATASPRATWNATTRRFELASSSGPAGIKDFVLDDALLTNTPVTESRDRTAMLYNHSDGWVWAPGNHAGPQPIASLDADLSNPSIRFNPNPSSTVGGATTGGTTTGGTTVGGSTTIGTTTGGTTTGGTTVGGSTTIGTTTGGTTTGGTTLGGSTTIGTTTGGTTTGGTTVGGSTTIGTTTGGTTTGGTTSAGPGPTMATTLPTPVIETPGGSYNIITYPSTITINPNGTPGTGSVLRVSLNGGPWTDYGGPFGVPSGTIVTAKNFTLDPTRYLDSSSDVETYVKLMTTFSGLVVPAWNNFVGLSTMVSSINNSNPGSVVAAHGQVTNSSHTQSEMTYNRTPFAGVPPDTDFKLGNMIYKNGNVSLGTSAISVNLHLDLTMASPAAPSAPLDLTMALLSTPNTNDPVASADFIVVVNPVTNYTVSEHGVTYKLQVKFANIATSQGWVDGATLHVYEGAVGTAELVGRFVTIY